MGIRNQKPGSGPIGPDSSQRPVRRDYVEEIQRHADQLHEAIEINSKINNEDVIAGQRQQQIQRHMAQLRCEAVQARRLAEQIDTLSQQTTPRKRKHAMTNSSTIDQERTQRLKRRASDKPAGGSSQSKFNPLHPSMELPPEQLIRLLGLEDKKSRKKRKSSTPEKSTRPASPRLNEKAGDRRATATKPAVPKATKARSAPSQSIRRRQRELTDTSVFGERRRGLLVPALGFGIVAGFAMSVYLLWGQPGPQKTVTAPAELAKPVASSKPAPVARKPLQTEQANSSIARTSTEKKITAPADNPKWRAAIRAQEQRLHDAAVERLNERKQGAGRTVATDAGTSTTVATPNIGAETTVSPVEPVPPTSDDSIYQAADEVPGISMPEQPLLADDETPLASPTENIRDVEAVPGQLDAGIGETGIPEPPASVSTASDAAPADPLPTSPAASDSSSESLQSLPSTEVLSTEPVMSDPPTDDSSVPDALAVEPETTGMPAQPDYSDTPDPAAGDAGISD